MYFLNAEQTGLVDEYAAALHRKIIAVVGEAIKDLGPAKLFWGGGETSFAVNRARIPSPRCRNWPQPESCAAQSITTCRFLR